MGRTPGFNRGHDAAGVAGGVRVEQAQGILVAALGVLARYHGGRR